MRILHVVRTSVTVKHFLIPFIRSQMDQGHIVAVAFDVADEGGIIENTDIKVHTYDFSRNMNIGNAFKAIGALRRIIEDGEFELIIVHMPLAAAVTRIAAKLSRNKPKTVYVVHGFPFAPQQPRLRWLFWFTTEWLLGKITDALFVMNNYDYNLAQKSRILTKTKNIRKITGMGVDLERFSPDIDDDEYYLQRLGIKHSKVILFTARMIREKGIFEFLKAAEILSEKDYAFVLIGDGPASEGISKYIIDHELSKRVFFLGWRDDVHEFMKRCDLFVLPTYYSEGLPVTILEAMACAKAVIACRQRGCEEEIVDGITGCLIKSRNPSQLAEKIDLLLNNEALRVKMGKAGRDRVEQLFSLDKALETFSESLTAVIDF